MKTMFLNMANKNIKEIELSQASSRINNEYWNWRKCNLKKQIIKKQQQNNPH